MRPRLTSYDLVKKQSKKQVFNILAQINSESVKQKRSHAALSETYSTPASDYGREGCITDEKNFYLNPPVYHQNDCVWLVCRQKRDIDENRLVVERIIQVCETDDMCYGSM